MKYLTKRTLRVFAVLENYRDGSSDILDAILLFFAPILSEFDGQLFDPTKFSLRVREENRWNFTSDIAEELIPSFVKKLWLEETSRTRSSATYKVTCPAKAENDTGIIERLESISQEFLDFIDKISPLSAVSSSKEQLGDILIEWLVSIDAYSEDVLRQQINKISSDGGRLEASIQLPDESVLRTDERYLCARFAQHILKTNSLFIQDLCLIASVGLLTEVVQDFQKPLTRTNRTDLTLYLDAPVALDLLGVSGTAAAENIRPIISKIQEIGGVVRVMRISIEELKRALDAVIERHPTLRTGPTADALRRNEVLEAFVREVARNPETLLRNTYNINVIDRPLDAFPGQHEYFSHDTYEAFYSKLNWHLESNPRIHDATAITQIMRLRLGNTSADIFESKHLFVTRNGILSQISRKFCLENGILPNRAIGPAIHQRQLAMAVWLRTGLSDIQKDVPKRYVLAACERVLELKKNVVDQVRKEAKNLTAEKAEQLELLLTQDRSVQVLMDKTLGISNVISAGNIEGLVDVMKASLVAEIEEKKTIEVGAITQEARRKVGQAVVKRKEAEKEAEDAKAIIATGRFEDREILEAFIRDVNRAIRIRRYTGVFCFAGLIVICPIVSVIFLSDNATRYISLLCACLLAFMLSLQMLDKPFNIRKFYSRTDNKKLKDIAEQRGLTKKLLTFSVDYDGDQFRILPDVKENSTPQTLPLD